MEEDKRALNVVRVSVGTRWKTGESGNPKGKPKGAIHLSSRIQRMLNSKNIDIWLPEYQDTGNKEVIPKKWRGLPIEALIMVQIQRAVNGDTKSADWLAKYGYGSKLEIEEHGEQKLIIETRRAGTEVNAKVTEVHQRQAQAIEGEVIDSAED